MDFSLDTEHHVDHRAEIAGRVDRKMLINALNSGANVFLADFEDANSPAWKNNLHGHVNLSDANRRNISYESRRKTPRAER